MVDAENYQDKVSSGDVLLAALVALRSDRVLCRWFVARAMSVRDLFRLFAAPTDSFHAGH